MRPGVLRDDAVGRVEHHLRRAVVLLQAHQPSAGKVLEEVLHVPHVGAPPAVDRLVVVAHRAHVAVRAQQLDQLVLRPVRVLELVDQDEAELGLVGAQPVRMLAEQRQRMHQEIVEVHRVGGLQRRPHGRVDVGRDLGEAVELRHPGRELRRRHQAVLGARDERLHRARREQLGGVAPLLHQPPDEAQAVVFVVDGELPAEPEQRRLPPEQAGGERMEGADPEARWVAVEQPSDPVLHLARGLVGEGHGEDPVRAARRGGRSAGRCGW